MTTPRSYAATAPLDQLTRALMDKGYSLDPREDVNHEYARLASPDSQIILFRCGCVLAADERAAALLFAMARGQR